MLPVIVVILLALHSGRGQAQSAATDTDAGTLPNVVYPTRSPEAVPNVPPPLPITPPADIAPVPAPVQYVWVGGFWGYRDQYGRFHRGPFPVNHIPDERRFPVVGTRAADVDRHEPRAGVITPSRSGIGLSNQPPRVIVVQTPATRDRNPVR